MAVLNIITDGTHICPFTIRFLTRETGKSVDAKLYGDFQTS